MSSDIPCCVGDKALDGYSKKKYVCKLLFIFLLGHDIDFGHMEAVNLLSSNRYTEKQIVSTLWGGMVPCAHQAGRCGSDGTDRLLLMGQPSLCYFSMPTPTWEAAAGVGSGWCLSSALCTLPWFSLPLQSPRLHCPWQCCAAGAAQKGT